MPTECSAESFDFGIVEGRCVEAAFDAGLVTSDTGSLLLGATDHKSPSVEPVAGFTKSSQQILRAEASGELFVPAVDHGLRVSTSCPVGGIAPEARADSGRWLLRRRRGELTALSSLSSASVLRMLRASRRISTQDNNST